MKKVLFISIAIVVLAFGAAVSAHTANREPAYKILGIAEPSLLPDSGFYFLKEIGRGFKRLFTFDAVKKAELELKITDEKLAELEKVATKSEAPEDAIQDAFENYLEAQERLARRLESLQGKNKNVDTLLEKLADRVVRHEELFNDLEDKLKEGEVKKVEKEIANAAKKALELDEKQFKEKLKAKIEREKEDDDEELEAIEDLIAADEGLEDLKEDLDEILADAKKSAAEAEFEDSEEKIEAAEDRVKEAKLTGKNADEVLRLLAEAKKHWGFAKSELEKKNYEQAKVHLGHVLGFLKDLESILATGKKSTDIDKKSKDFKECGPKPGAPGSWVCKDGKWQLAEDKPREPVVCTQQYDPVCGIDGKTYSNSCFAGLAEVSIKHKGECQSPAKATPPSTPAPTPTLNPQDTPKAQSQEFKLEADDFGFYPADTLTVTKGAKVKIAFTVRTTNVYYGGLDFRSSKFATAAAKPGGTATVEFTADEPFTITSYWPLSGVKKAELKVEAK